MIKIPKPDLSGDPEFRLLEFQVLAAMPPVAFY
jgi:hypothetical protein